MSSNAGSGKNAIEQVASFGNFMRFYFGIFRNCKFRETIYIIVITCFVFAFTWKPIFIAYITSSRKYKYFLFAQVNKVHVELELRRRKMDSLMIGSAVVGSARKQGMPDNELISVLRRGNAEIDLDAGQVRGCITNTSFLPSWLFYFNRNDLSESDPRVASSESGYMLVSIVGGILSEVTFPSELGGQDPLIPGAGSKH